MNSQNVSSYLFLSILCSCMMAGCQVSAPDEERLSEDLKAQPYVQNCLRQGLTLQDQQLLKEEKTASGFNMLMQLIFEGPQTSQTRTLLCLPVSTVTLKYRSDGKDLVFDRLSLELSRTQLNDHLRNPQAPASKGQASQ